jgi:hypothetical protein
MRWVFGLFVCFLVALAVPVFPSDIKGPAPDLLIEVNCGGSPEESEAIDAPPCPLKKKSFAALDGGEILHLRGVDFIGGFGFSHQFFVKTDAVFLMSFVERFNYPLTKKIEFAPEIMQLFSAPPKRGVGVGAAPLLKFRLYTFRDLDSFFTVGAGVLVIGLKIPQLDSRLNFAPQAGLGIKKRFGPRATLSFEYRYLHVSNANSAGRNIGLNSSLLLFGYGREF